MPATAPPRGVRSTGQPLPTDARRSLESAYGWDLGAVRLHDAPAERGQAHALRAQAYAGGSHIVHAGPGALPRPHVLAHEVAHAVQSAVHPGGPANQRYESPEHEDLGDSALRDLLAFLQTPDGVTWAKKQGLDAAQTVRQIQADPLGKAGGRITVGKRTVPGKQPGQTEEETVTLSPGEIIALSGDLYAGPESIGKAASKAIEKKGGKNEIDQLLQAIGDERSGKLDDPNKTYENITGGRYLKMASQNDIHFAPKNRDEWQRLHQQALDEAKTAGHGTKMDADTLNHALLVDASGGHFLTDAYASGHLFRANVLMAAIQAWLAVNPLRTQSPEVQFYASVVAWADKDRLLILKLIHDRLNVEGFEVTNGRGMKWKTYGDANLAKTPDTQRIASLAVFTSRQQVYAAQRGETPNPQDVLDLMPDNATLQRATDQAISYIPFAAANVQGLMYRGRKLAPLQFPPVVGQIIQSNLSTIASPGRERQLLDLQSSSQNNPSLGQQLAPQFTVLEFP